MHGHQYAPIVIASLCTQTWLIIDRLSTAGQSLALTRDRRRGRVEFGADALQILVVGGVLQVFVVRDKIQLSI